MDKLDKISTIDTVIIDKTIDMTDIEISFIESLREHGILDIHFFTNNYRIENQANNLVYILDFSKYAMEIIYQNQLLSLSITIIGIVLSFNQGIKLIYAWLLSITNEILVYLNSLRLLNYEPIYI